MGWLPAEMLPYPHRSRCLDARHEVKSSAEALDRALAALAHDLAELNKVESSCPALRGLRDELAGLDLDAPGRVQNLLDELPSP